MTIRENRMAMDVDADEPLAILDEFVRERLRPHPLVAPYLDTAAIWLTGGVALGVWDEETPLHVRLLVSDPEHEALGRTLKQAQLWDPSVDWRLILRDEEPIRRYPGAWVHVTCAAELRGEAVGDLCSTLWWIQHARLLTDPGGRFDAERNRIVDQFDAQLGAIRAEHYYWFRSARSGMQPRVRPGRSGTLLAIKRGLAVREALRLTFLADGLPYPEDGWLEHAAESETRAGEAIVAASRALIAARDAAAIEHTGKVLRDRVVMALQQGGVREAWLEQWWLWARPTP